MMTATPSPPNPKRILRLLILADLVALLLAYCLAWGLATLINEIFYARSLTDNFLPGQFDRLLTFVGISAGALLWFSHRGHYRQRLPFWSELEQVVYTLGFCLLIDSFWQFASKQDFSRVWLVSSWVLGAILLLICRAQLRQLLRRDGRWRVPTLLIGDGPTATEARFVLQQEQALGYDITQQLFQLPPALLSQQQSWRELCATHNAHFVLLALEGHDLSEAEDALAELNREHIPYAICPPLRGVPVVGMEATYFFSQDVMLLSRVNRLEEPVPRALKRAFDLVASSLGLFVLAVPLLSIALLIRASGGPALYRDRRIGANGKQFDCLKFRTMVQNGEALLTTYLAQNPDEAARWETHRKLAQDPRVTKLGRWLRRTSLDELPQLINVLKGEMSIVGPRPAMVSEQDRFGRDLALYTQVRPGITGLWQVSGRNHVTFDQRVLMDSWYVRNWSLWADIAIIAKTFPVVFGRRGAY